jgi:hypothetical protein
VEAGTARSREGEQKPKLEGREGETGGGRRKGGIER